MTACLPSTACRHMYVKKCMLFALFLHAKLLCRPCPPAKKNAAATLSPILLLFLSSAFASAYAYLITPILKSLCVCVCLCVYLLPNAIAYAYLYTYGYLFKVAEYSFRALFRFSANGSPSARSQGFENSKI